ncbi:MAG: electron transfer flavoprotein subunit beta [Geopsychrobacter sp.]|nr:electron transfer flavoprotein subunit beta [Geopsychrobacter sp.]
MSQNKLNIVVLLREACDPQPPVRLTADGYGVRERGLRRIANPADICALEQALTLAEAQNGSVTVVAIGPQRLDDLLRLALSMGAQRAVRVWNSAFKGGDAFADARLIERLVDIFKPDFMLSGHRLIDKGADPALALASAKLGIPYVTAALSVESIDGEVEVLRKCDRGARQLIGTSTPCTLLFEEGCCAPRYPTQTGLVESVEMPIEVWGEADLGLPFCELGGAGALLAKDRCSFPRQNPQRVVTPDANLPAFERILALLSGGIKPREGKLHNVSAVQTAEMLFDIFAAEGLVTGSKG